MRRHRSEHGDTDQASAIRRLCLQTGNSDVEVYPASSSATAWTMQLVVPWPDRERVCRALRRIGWRVEQGQGHLTVLGWSAKALADRLRLLHLACADLRQSHAHSVHTALTIAEDHLNPDRSAPENEIADRACAAVRGQLHWSALVEEADGITRHCTDPAIAATMAAIIEAETALTLLIIEHVRVARRAVEVLWRCRRTTCGALSPEAARSVAWQEALRLVDRRPAAA
ncbi:hypothetical protein GCM10014719_47790 [Planomonospora parontospora subsp. antibiotica]|nr:hypothetical protein GCM10014719_47790 [Planomonospora parontospora subsp. antibiotica]GII17908.1 hypothetical protein Ppa05_46340 [Planomonospora parontospora subsp. antibiotica]